jgi:hypothetical protein
MLPHVTVSIPYPEPSQYSKSGAVIICTDLALDPDPSLFFVVWDYTCSYWHLLISSVQRLEPQIPMYL